MKTILSGNILIVNVLFEYMVRVEGLEPPRLAAPEPKSGASTNFATPAFKKYIVFLKTVIKRILRIRELK